MFFSFVCRRNKKSWRVAGPGLHVEGAEGDPGRALETDGATNAQEGSLWEACSSRGSSRPRGGIWICLLGDTLTGNWLA